MLKRATAVRTYSLGIGIIVATTLLLTGCSTTAVEPTSAQVKSAVARNSMMRTVVFPLL